MDIQKSHRYYVNSTYSCTSYIAWILSRSSAKILSAVRSLLHLETEIEALVTRWDDAERLRNYRASYLSDSRELLPAMNGNAVASIVFLLPRYSMQGPPAIPPKSALSGISDPIHMPCNVRLKVRLFIRRRDREIARRKFFSRDTAGGRSPSRYFWKSTATKV